MYDYRNIQNRIIFYICIQRRILMLNNKKIIVVLPAYNAAKTLQETYKEIPFDMVDEVILVDDASNDGTVEVAKKIATKQEEIDKLSADIANLDKDIQNNQKAISDLHAGSVQFHENLKQIGSWDELNKAFNK